MREDVSPGLDLAGVPAAGTEYGGRSHASTEPFAGNDVDVVVGFQRSSRRETPVVTMVYYLSRSSTQGVNKAGRLGEPLRTEHLQDASVSNGAGRRRQACREDFGVAGEETSLDGLGQKRRREMQTPAGSIVRSQCSVFRHGPRTGCGERRGRRDGLSSRRILLRTSAQQDDASKKGVLFLGQSKRLATCHPSPEFHLA